MAASVRLAAVDRSSRAIPSGWWRDARCHVRVVRHAARALRTASLSGGDSDECAAWTTSPRPSSRTFCAWRAPYTMSLSVCRTLIWSSRGNAQITTSSGTAVRGQRAGTATAKADPASRSGHAHQAARPAAARVMSAGGYSALRDT